MSLDSFASGHQMTLYLIGVIIAYRHFAGFMHNHARVNSYWGYSTYYSTAPLLTLHLPAQREQRRRGSAKRVSCLR